MELGFGTAPALNLLRLPYRMAHLGESGFRERRSTLHFYKVWEAARGAKRLPCLTDFDLSLIERFGGGCFLLEFEGNGAPAKFRYFGRDLAAAVQHDLTGYSIASVPQSSLLAQLIPHCAAALQSGKPLALDGVFAENATAHLLYRSILLPFAKTGDKAECVLGSLQFRRVQARGRITSRLTRTKAPLPVRLEQVQPVQNLLSVTYPEQFRTALSHARQHAAKVRAEETTGADQMFAAMRSGMRRAIWPLRVTQCMRSAPVIGKAVLSEQHSEFALLLARRVDATSGRYEIVSMTSPALLNMAMRSAFVASQRKHRRNRKPCHKP